MSKEHKLVDTKRSKLTESFLRTFEDRISANPPGVCPIATHLSYIRLARAQSCGKCIPCAKGLEQLENIMVKIMEGNGTLDDYVEMYWLADTIKATADCAIGYEAAFMVLACIKNNKDEYMSHINNHRCSADVVEKIPCRYNCPAGVNVPGYISLIANDRCEDAVNLIRERNPFPTTCAFVCEKPCELQCRRKLIDDQVNIKGLKRYAVDNVDFDKLRTPHQNPSTGKKIAIVGGGPSGLTCAFFLARMGHDVVIYEKNDKLGGMLYYGIPNYRLPKDRLEKDINGILKVGGIEVIYNKTVGRDVSLSELKEQYDAIYFSIGAGKGKILPIENSDNAQVETAVEMLRKTACKSKPDLTGKNVVVIGGGNVAIDCARSAVRCGAKSVTLSVREHQSDMTAQPSEIQAAIEEGIQLLTMYAPVSLKTDENGQLKTLVLQPQITSLYDPQTGSPTVKNANKEPFELDCDVCYMAIGQTTETESFSELALSKQNTFITDNKTYMEGCEKIFAGGDCVSGPATAIKAIGAGRIAAINIDEYLGFHHAYREKIDIPPAAENMRHHIGRVNPGSRFARERKNDFEPVELCMSKEEALQECSKCLRCDVYGSGCLEGEQN